MKTLILLLVASNLSVSMQSVEANSTYCEWLGNAAIVIAQNRDNGMSEIDLIDNYLQQNQSYVEQQVIIPLIDRVYSTEKGIGPSEIAIVEQQLCEIA